MSNQTLNNKSEYIIPDIATKIKNLSATKLVLLKMIIDMYPMSNDPIFSVYAGPLIKLLQYIINIHKNTILSELEDGLTSTLVTYIFDINELIKGQLNLETYAPRHKNLVAVHQKIDYYLNHYDPQGLEELKAILFLI